MKALRTIIITGVSGAGKTTALRVMEDLGFYCVDNLPLPLLTDFMEAMKADQQVDRVALVVDARLGKNVEGYALASLALIAAGYSLEVIYLDASDVVLLRRFSQTRRRHPLGSNDLEAGLREERDLLTPLRDQAMTCIDTSDLTVHQLKQIFQDRYQSDDESLVLSLISFGFRFGLPSYADLLFDVRFLPNPFFVDGMRELTGKHPDVEAYIMKSEETAELLGRLESLLDYLIPRYEAEGKVYFTVAIGCTGGRHRSVVVAEALAKKLGKQRTIKVRHRDIER